MAGLLRSRPEARDPARSSGRLAVARGRTGGTVARDDRADSHCSCPRAFSRPKRQRRRTHHFMDVFSRGFNGVAVLFDPGVSVDRGDPAEAIPGAMSAPSDGASSMGPGRRQGRLCGRRGRRFALRFGGSDEADRTRLPVEATSRLNFAAIGSSKTDAACLSPRRPHVPLRAVANDLDSEGPPRTGCPVCPARRRRRDGGRASSKGRLRR